MTETRQTQSEMPRAYEPWKVEQKWYQFWLERGYFTPKIDPQWFDSAHHRKKP
ncbi:MAG: hypothetical protein HY662_04085, partial [Chloroflexi bacterium]|nr:hypothetical protein [Chloroflexota bacterium]